jgi:hypothetical protein
MNNTTIFVLANCTVTSNTIRSSSDRGIGIIITEKKEKKGRLKEKKEVNKGKGNNNGGPLVTFWYGGVERYVRVISVNNRYITGLEISVMSDGRQQYKYKKFLRGKIHGLDLLEYAPGSMS